MTEHKFIDPASGDEWMILKVAGGYLAERQRDYHIAPRTFRLLRQAQQAIVDGEAQLTQAEWDAREIVGTWQSLTDQRAYRQHVEKMAWHGIRKYVLALEIIEGKETT